MWVYQFGYLDELGYPVSTNYALDELRSFGDRPVWINPLWFWECHSAAPQGSAGTRPPPRSALRARIGVTEMQQLTAQAQRV